MSNSLNIMDIPHKNCTGCAVCMNICPTKSIKMIQEIDGFFYPSVDNHSCVSCGLCYENCHLNRDNDYWVNNIVYAGHYEDKSIWASCSSGGVATAISKLTINEGGYVCGVVYDDDFRNAKYLLTNNLNELDKMKGSKYIQPSPPNYDEIKKILQIGKMLTFFGLPCQCDALQSFLNKKYDNLIMVSLICHGPTSSLVLKKYVDELENKYGKICDLKLRFKRNGYVRPTRILVKNNCKKKFVLSFICSSFGRAFELLNRESCAQCNSKYPSGFADIIIGDFWGGKDRVTKENEFGENIIILRNTKLKPFVEKLKAHGFILEKAEFAGISKKNPALISSTVTNFNRNAFIKDIQFLSLKESINKNTRIKELIINYIYFFVRTLIPNNIWKLFKGWF